MPQHCLSHLQRVTHTVVFYRHDLENEFGFLMLNATVVKQQV